MLLRGPHNPASCWHSRQDNTDVDKLALDCMETSKHLIDERIRHTATLCHMAFEPYQYLPLTDLRSIRLLTVLPDTASDDVSVLVT